MRNRQRKRDYTSCNIKTLKAFKTLRSRHTYKVGQKLAIFRSYYDEIGRRSLRQTFSSLAGVRAV